MFPGTYARLTPDKPAIIMGGTGETLTYAQLDTRSLRFARHLYDDGVRRGDHVAVLSDNQARALEVYWAALRSGLCVTFINSQLSADEVAYIVNDCGAKTFVASEKYAPIMARVVAQTPLAARRIALGAIEGFDAYEALIDAASTQPLPAQPCGVDMLYSSGTTGFPKGIEVPLPDRTVDDPGDSVTATFGLAFGFDADSVYLSPAPIYHSAPLRFTAMVHRLGGTVVMMEKFDAEQALRLIERYRVTHSQWVPTMFIRMLKLDAEIRDRYDLSSLRSAIHAAAPCPVEVKRAMIDWWGPILLEYYSSTEASGSTLIDSRDWLAHPGSVGKAALGVVHICDIDDPDGADVPTGQIGTIYFERETAPFEYHNDPQRTADTRHPKHPNWTTSGDIGYLDADGYLYLTDRKSFMIISGGVNIYPQEIENALALHPAVLDVGVVGVPDGEMGESVLAVVHPAAATDSRDELAAALDAFLRERIAHYKLPRRYEFTDDLPRTPTGKLVKGRLRERYG